MSVGFHLRQTSAEVQAIMDKVQGLLPGALDSIGIYAKDDSYWAAHLDFVPELGALLIYTDLRKFKLGNGEDSVAELPFVDAALEQAVVAHISDSVRHITKQERQYWNNKSDFSGRYQDLTGRPFVPTKLSDLNSDSGHRTVSDAEKAAWNAKVDQSQIQGFVTKSVDDLLNYYLKSETYTKEEVQQMIAAVQGLSFEVVSMLPTASADTMHKIYLVPSADPQSQNIKDEYITIDNGGSAGLRYFWEQIGSTAINLSGYVTTEDLNDALSAFPAVKYIGQTLSDAQKEVARDNIEAVGAIEVGEAEHPDFTGVVPILYGDLVDLRDEEELQPGTLYRITDYVATTTQVGTRSANHPFDVIVLALSNSALSENAWAVQHEGDAYFSDSNLVSWQLKYCLDNDAYRFLWADTESGKGVIYYMCDEHDNECPYDFKNIQFIRTASWFADHANWCTRVLQEIPDTDIYFYTFSLKDGSAAQDMSLLSGCHNNAIGLYSVAGQRLNNNVFVRGASLVSTFPYNNRLGFGCYDNSIGDGFVYNVCLGDFINNVIGTDVQYNNFGVSFVGNAVGDICTYCTFGQHCGDNVFVGEMEHTSIGNNVRYVDISIRGISNCIVSSGVQGTNGQHLVVPFSAGRGFTQTAGIATNGVLKIWNPADFLQYTVNE